MTYLETLKNELIVRGYSKKTLDHILMYVSDFIEFCNNKSYSLECLTKENIMSI
jgi:hypothetical protein